MPNNEYGASDDATWEKPVTTFGVANGGGKDNACSCESQAPGVPTDSTVVLGVDSSGGQADGSGFDTVHLIWTPAVLTTDAAGCLEPQATTYKIVVEVEDAAADPDTDYDGAGTFHYNTPLPSTICSSGVVSHNPSASVQSCATTMEALRTHTNKIDDPIRF